MKNILSICLVFLSMNLAFGLDSLTIKKAIVGPPELVLPPPVDSAKLIKLSVSQRLKKTSSEKADVLSRQGLVDLYSLLAKTETVAISDVGLVDRLGELLTECKSSGDLKGESSIYNTYGVYYARSGQTDKAIYFFNEALKLKERLKDDAGALQIAGNLAALYKLSGKYQLALNFLQYVVETNMRLKNATLNARTYLDIASIKLLQSKFKESEYYILRKAFPLYQRRGSKWGRMLCFQNLADLYFKQERYGEAKWFYLQSQMVATKLMDNQSMIVNLTGLGKVKSALGEYSDALKNFKQAEQLAKNNNYFINLVEINAGLGEMYSLLGDYKAANAALDQYAKAKDSWFEVNKL